MSYGHTPDGDEGSNDAGGRSGGTVYGSSSSRGAARIPSDGAGSSGSGTVYGGSARSGGTTYGSGGTTYGSGSASGGTTYGSGSSGAANGQGTTYGSGSAASSGTTYGSRGTTYGAGGATGGTTYGSGAASGGTTYGSPSAGAVPAGQGAASQGTTYGARSTTYGGTAVGDRPGGIGPRSRAAAFEEDQLEPQYGGVPTGRDDLPPGAKARKRKKILIGVGIGTVACLLLGLLGGGVAYATTDLPAFPTVSQTTQLKYADGGTFATFATENRVEVKLSEVPKWVQNEVVAAEDQDFWDNGGVSIRGTGRAVWGLVRGNDDAGGGSTITQQYVRNALNLDRGRSYTRKVKEIILAQKLGNSMSKEDILQGYLNTIYFGRSAWGIQAASKAYFGKEVKKLTPAEGAVLAAVIKDPTNFDPANRLASAKGRWTYVMNSMVKKGFMSQADRSQQVYPTSKQLLEGTTKGSGAWRNGSTGVLGYRVEQELLKAGFKEQDINTGGLVVQTTISSKAQAAAAKASRKYVNAKDQDPRMATAMVSIDPATGAVKAYYGGDKGYGTLDLASAKAPHPAGSSFKPYVAAAGLTAGYSIDSLWNGTSGQTLPGRDTPLKNSDGESCGEQCTLTTAMVMSVNTVFWALTDKVGVNTVAKTAQAAGITALDSKPIGDQIKSKQLNDGLGIGQYQVSVLDQASGYATIADYGVYHQPYFVSKVLNPDGSVAWDHASNAAPEVQAWSKDVGRDLNYVLLQDYKANKKNQIGRDAAIKTGTQQYQNTTENSHAWLCGFTPQIATAVWVGSGTADFPLRDKANGNIHVYGNGIPGSIWTDYMEAVLTGHKVVDFQEPVHAGTKSGNAPSAEPSPTPSEQPQETPDATESDQQWWQSADPNASSPTDGQSTNTDGNQNNNNQNNTQNNTNQNNQNNNGNN